jgi:hypothetical protein
MAEFVVEIYPRCGFVVAPLTSHWTFHVSVMRGYIQLFCIRPLLDFGKLNFHDSLKGNNSLERVAAAVVFPTI